MSRKYYISFVLLGLLSLLLLSSFRINLKETLSPPGKLIWRGNSHAAFTSLLYYNNSFYCAFRNAQRHADTRGEDCGVIIIICSKDGNNWDHFLTFSEKGYDLRDPQLSITPKGELMLLAEKVKYENNKAVTRNSCVSFIKEDGSSSSLKPIVFEACQNWNWIWNVEWIDGEAWGFCYAPYFGLVKSTDGITYNLVQTFNLERNPTEASITKLNRREYVAVVRTDGVAYLGIFNVKKRTWHWNDLQEEIACPKIISAKGKVFVAGRSYNGGVQTTLYKLNKRKKQLDVLVRIPGGKDCSYPGMVYKRGKFFISYYNGDVSTSDIYLATYKY